MPNDWLDGHDAWKAVADAGPFAWCDPPIGDLMASHLTFHPILDRLVVRPFKAPERTATGIELLESAQPEPTEGHVLAVGEACHPALTVGARVLYQKYAGWEVDLNGETVRILGVPDVLSVVVAG